MLFVDMMEEAYEKEQFKADGPLWVEAYMHDHCVEILVTKGKDYSDTLTGRAYEPTLESWNKSSNKGGGHKMSHDMFSSQLQNRSLVADNQVNSQQTVYYTSVYKFRDIENVIQLSQRLHLPFFDSKLISFSNQYYLVVQYPENKWIKGKDIIESLILEYGDRSYTSIYRLEEYGKVILAENAIATIKNYFKVLP